MRPREAEVLLYSLAEVSPRQGGEYDMTADTIAAIATAPGVSAIGVVRLSGPDAIILAEKVFRAKNRKPLDQVASHQMIYGSMISAHGVPIDDGLLVMMRGPHSYTGEDVVELHCHGNTTILHTLLAALLTHGARLADAGEFTRRAFVNGKLDLLQVEAVGDLLQARSTAGVELAAQQLTGALPDRFEAMRQTLVGFLAHVHAAIDYPEEVPEVSAEEWQSEVQAILAACEELLANAASGIRLREGVDTVIIGKPNVGKSSLLNAILRTQRAIVTAIAGTTRDVIEESVEISGVSFRLSDTAGLRATDDPVEKEGVLRTQQRLAAADLVLAVFDASQPLSADDEDVLTHLRGGAQKAIVVCNKSDLPEMINPAAFGALPVVKVSAKLGRGLAELEAMMADAAGVVHARQVQSTEQNLLSRPRQIGALEGMATALRQTLASMAAGVTPDCLAADLEEALWHLGALTGETTPDEIVDEIFHRFCVGK
jgi:tRNA modification GTPase